MAANRKAVAGFFEDFSAGRIYQAFARVADDATWWVPGTLPFSGGKHANGKLYQNTYHFLIVLKDCRFVQVKEYMDTLHLAQLIAK